MDRVVILVDYENIFNSIQNNFSAIPSNFDLAAKIKEIAMRYGSIVISKIYGDWTRRSNVPRDFQRNGYESCLVLSKETGRDRTDTRLILDAMKILNDNLCEVFIFCAGDSSYTDLIREIHCQSKKTIVVAITKTTATELISECEFIPLEKELKLQPLQTFGFDEAIRPFYDWAAFIIQLDKLEKSLPFVGLKYFRDNFITTTMCTGNNKNMINEAVTRGIIEIGKVDNPNNPVYKTAICKLKRDSDLIKSILETKS